LEEINPLQTTLIERGIVSSRVALLLRSAEIKPIVLQICSYEQHLSFYLSGQVLLKGYSFCRANTCVFSEGGWYFGVVFCICYLLFGGIWVVFCICYLLFGGIWVVFGWYLGGIWVEFGGIVCGL
jgi:hypothetical protein